MKLLSFRQAGAAHPSVREGLPSHVEIRAAGPKHFWGGREDKGVGLRQRQEVAIGVVVVTDLPHWDTGQCELASAERAWDRRSIEVLGMELQRRNDAGDLTREKRTRAHTASIISSSYATGVL